MISNYKLVRHQDQNILIPKSTRFYQRQPTDALQFDADEELAGSCYFKSLSLIGGGSLKLNAAIDGLKGYFYYLKSAVYRLMKSGNGIYCAITVESGGQALMIHILRGVAEYLHTSFSSYYQFEISPEQYVGYGRQHEARGGVPVYIAVLFSNHHLLRTVGLLQFGVRQDQPCGVDRGFRRNKWEVS